MGTTHGWALTRRRILLKLKAELADAKQQLQVRMKSLTMSQDEGALEGVLVQAGLRDISSELAGAPPG